MKSIRSLLVCASIAAASTAATAADAVVGQFYVAEASGGVSYVAAGKVDALRKGNKISAQGAKVETLTGSSAILVYSNGTAVYVDQDSSLEVRRFEQDPFPAGTDTTLVEPSKSNTVGYIFKGRIAIQTNKLFEGTKMVYITPRGAFRIKGGQVAIEVLEGDETTYVSVLAGEAVFTTSTDGEGSLGQTVTAGELLTVVSPKVGTTGQGETMTVTKLTETQISVLIPLFELTQRAKSTVVFENTGNGITANSVVPATPPPTTITISPTVIQ